MLSSIAMVSFFIHLLCSFIEYFMQTSVSVYASFPFFCFQLINTNEHFGIADVFAMHFIKIPIPMQL